MWERNNGDERNILQNQFTAYLVIAIKNQKAGYLRNQSHVKRHETSLELQDNLLDGAVEVDFFFNLALMQQLENERLHDAIKRLKERDRYIFFAKVLDGCSFSQLAEELRMSYGAVAMAYHRTIERIKKSLGGENE